MTSALLMAAIGQELEPFATPGSGCWSSYERFTCVRVLVEVSSPALRVILALVTSERQLTF